MLSKQVSVIIPARGGSKGIPKKNIKDFFGKPLIAWCIEAALECAHVGSTIVSSDDEEILSISQRLGATPHYRSKDLSSDTTTTEEVLIDILSDDHENDEDALICLMQCTSPYVESSDLSGAIEIFHSNSSIDSLLSVTANHRFIWSHTKNNFIKPLNYDPNRRHRRQDLPKQYMENGAFYIFKKKEFLNYQCRIYGNIYPYLMDEWKHFELDSISDWKVGEHMFKTFYKGVEP